jgi:hypothetical protein
MGEYLREGWGITMHERTVYTALAVITFTAILFTIAIGSGLVGRHSQGDPPPNGYHWECKQWDLVKDTQ